MHLKHVFIFLATVFLIHVRCFSQPCAETSQLINLIRQHHFQPVNIDQEFQQNLILAFFDDLDENGIFFSQAEIEDIKAEFKDKDILFGCHFIDKVTESYKQSIQLVIAELQHLSTINLNYHQDEYLQAVRDSLKQQRKNRIAQYLKLKVLTSFFFELENQDSQDFSGFVKKMQSEVVEETICRLKNRLEGDLKKLIKEVFLQSVARQFDPHTSYFNLEDKLIFENSLSRETLSYGFEMNYNFANELVITQLTIGGPAWKSQQIQENDVIQKLVIADGQELSPGCILVKDLWSQVNASASVVLHLTSVDGFAKIVELKQEKLPSQENVINSLVLQGDHKIGYIKLPSFYSQFEDDYPRLGCANDVAKEILYLKKEGISGLILDLRDNGGGSMKEAIELVGIFIDEGIFFLEKRKDKPTRVVKDVNKGLAYDGPLIILVNGRSASASELVSASLQSYNRALIVGSRTYGKATGQNMYPMPESQAVAKITTSKFFRTDGSTYQKYGVLPDIMLPDLYEKIIPREMDQEKAINEDRSFKNVAFEALPELPLEKIKTQSSARLQGNEFFQQVNHLNNSLSNLVSGKDPVALQYEKFKVQAGVFKQLLNLLQNYRQDNEFFKAANHTNAQRMLLFNPDAKLVNEQLIKIIEEDPYVQEAFLNMQNLISINP